MSDSFDNHQWQRQKRYPNSGQIFDNNQNVFDVTDLLKRMLTGLDSFNHTLTAEYSPLIERIPLPGVSEFRDRLEPEGGNVYTDSGETVIDGTLEKTTLYTREHGKYLPGLVGLAGIGVRFENKSQGYYEFGYGTSKDRMGLEVDNGEEYTFIQSNGNRYYRKHRSEWLDPLDGTGPSGLIHDLNSTVLRIPFSWYGYLSVVFAIAVPDPLFGDRIVIIDRSGGTDDKVNIEQPSLPLFVEATNGVIRVGGRQYGVYGRYKPEFRLTCSPNITKTVETNFEPVVSFKAKEGDIWGAIRAYSSRLSLLTTDNVEYAIFINPTLTDHSFGGIPNIAFDETSLLMDTSATAISGGIKIYGDNASGASGNSQSADDTIMPDIIIPTGSSVTACARKIGSGSSTVNMVFKVQEEF